MPQLPDRHSLGRIQIDGAGTPSEINPMVAYDIGRAGAEMDKSLSEVSRIFGRLAASRKKVEDDTWLSERKIATLKGDDELRRGLDQTAAEDGSGFEQAPDAFRKIVQTEENVEGGSQEARTAYRLWAAQQGYETGRWAATSAQGRLKDSTLRRVDNRLDEMTNLSAANPDRSTQYFTAFKEEVESLIGTALDAPSASAKVERARENILKAGVLTKTKRNPTDFARALKALEDAGVSTDKPQVAGNDAIARAARGEGVSEQTMRVFAKIESGGDPSARTGSYKGLYQLSDSEFAKYGGAPGKILDADENSRAAARKLKAEASAFRSKHGRDPTAFDLYLIHQQGEGGAEAHMTNPGRLAWQNMASTKEGRQKGAAWAKKAIWGNIPDDMKDLFPGGVDSVTSEQFMNVWRSKVARFGAAPSQAVASEVELKKLPTVAGSIQPAELMSLRPEDFQAVTREIKPYLAAEMQEKVQDAAASLLASGTQTVLTPEDLALAPMIAGPKVAAKWKDVLDEAQDMHNITSSAKQMTRMERRQHIAAIQPTADSGPYAEEERRHFERWIKVDDHIEKAMKVDPVGWFATQNEAGKAAMQVIATAEAGDVRSREKAYETLLQLQREEGLDQKDITLLSKNDAERVVNQLTSAKSGQEAIGNLTALRQQYGRHFDTVWGQLSRQGAPASFLAMPTASVRGQNAVVETIILEKTLAESGGKDVDKKSLLRQRAGVKTQEELSRAVNEELGDFSAALDPSSFGLNEGYRQAVEKVTLYHMIAGGKSLDDAAEQAARDVFRDKITVYSGVLIPNDEYGAPMQRAKIRQGVDNAGKVISALADQIVVPTPASPGKTDAYIRSRYVNRIAADAKLVTSNNMQGVHLLDFDGKRVMVNSPQGPTPFFMSWKQLQENGERPPSAILNRLYN
jgi:hypothetical protein